ncbi:lipopolysaccharide transport periplasmic protein LptA [Methylophaga thiooxydans]|uniref:Lipopolysaccharide export system protein LptA n=1 Tax=Methylophaga thiooxydans DMS010 TaxID=637616 RepID=C0N2J4_9GAMM|nr:lipopolysaccharide transport periplasmic protein LptA [Methylophaga thiooxydans]EEF80989.1 cell envelope biogenesis protein YhbN, putative [Methylophaga thiooxydans DMS010]
MPLQTKLITVLLLMLPSLVWALPSDREQPINIEADHAQLDDREGVTQYKGDAILTQGTLRIEGDIITFYYDENKQIEKMVAQGKLATYKQVHKPGEAPVRAKALQMEYFAGRQKIYLIGQGHVWQSGDEFTGNRIEYDIERNVVTANSAPVSVGGEKQEKGRVHIIIQPPGNKKKTTPAQPKAEKKPAPEAAETKDSENTDASSKAYPTALTSTALNVRSGPGTHYLKLGTFAPSEEVIVLTRQTDWSQVRGMIDGEVVIGWVNSRYLK